jgi:WD40 repeat protein
MITCIKSAFWKIPKTIVFILFLACTSKPETPVYSNIGSDPLDTAIRESSDYLNNRLTKGIKLVFLNFQSDCPTLSEYIIDSQIENTVNDGIFTVVDRQNLALIQQEMSFQLSGEVSDESAQAIGKLLGAQVIVSGIISQLGNSYRLRVRAISVETAEIQGQFNRDIISSSRLIALISNCKATQSQTTYPAGNPAVPNQEDSSVQTNPPSSAPPLPVSTTTLPYETFIVKRELDVTNTGSFAISPDGKYVIVETNTGQRLCDAETGKVIRNIDIPRFSVAAFSPDGRRIITNSGYNIRLTDVETGAYRDCIGHSNPSTIRSLAYSPDGKYFVSAASANNTGGNYDNTVRIWDAETGQEIRVIRGHNGAVGYALFSPNGQTIVSRDNKSIYFWNIANGELLRTISSPNNADFTSSLAYSPDGTKIAAVTGNRIIVFDSQNGRELFSLTGYTGILTGMVFNPIGSRLISVSNGQTQNLMIWNMSSGWGTQNRLSIGGGGYSSLALSSDGTALFVNIVGRRTYVLGMD